MQIQNQVYVVMLLQILTQIQSLNMILLLLRGKAEGYEAMLDDVGPVWFLIDKQ